jgi:DNA helicase IV
VFAAGLDVPHLALWLTDRIDEIERMTGRFPSIAVLVNSEAEVEPVATALDDALIDLNIRCEACKDGQSRGKDNNVRVFDVQHIKGLEFEAVFFVGVDVLAENKPDLFDKFLYVGATRAATYLGITTVEHVVPAILAPLLSDFGHTFEELGS